MIDVSKAILDLDPDDVPFRYLSCFSISPPWAEKRSELIWERVDISASRTFKCCGSELTIKVNRSGF